MQVVQKHCVATFFVSHMMYDIGSPTCRILMKCECPNGPIERQSYPDKWGKACQQWIGMYLDGIG